MNSPFTENRRPSHTHRALGWPRRDSHIVPLAAWGELLEGLRFFLIGTWYQPPGWNSVLFSDDLPVLVRCNREILGQNHYRGAFVNSPVRRDLVHPPWCSGLRAVSRGRPRKVGATWSDAAVSKLEAGVPDTLSVASRFPHCTSFASGTSISMFVEANWMKLNHSS